MQCISEHSATAEPKENEGDMVAVSDLADDLRDAVIEYQVRTDAEKPAPDNSLMPLIVLGAEGNLRAKL